MKIYFKPIQRVNPQDSEGVRLFYPAIIRDNKMTFKDVVRKISSMSTVRSPDVYAVLNSLFLVMEEQLSEGRSIRLGDVGSLYLTIKGEGKEKAEDLTAFDIKSRSIRFTPSAEMKRGLEQIRFEKFEPKQ